MFTNIYDSHHLYFGTHCGLTGISCFRDSAYLSLVVSTRVLVLLIRALIKMPVSCGCWNSKDSKHLMICVVRLSHYRLPRYDWHNDNHIVVKVISIEHDVESDRPILEAKIVPYSLKISIIHGTAFVVPQRGFSSCTLTRSVCTEQQHTKIARSCALLV
jgi:hypothetical protein